MSVDGLPVALITPSHRKDIERFTLLCDSIDRYITGRARHYVIVNDDDVPHFAHFNSADRVVMPGSRLLPRWLIPLPSFLSRNGRRVWWSLRSGPVHGWHIQQILKITAAMQLPEQRFCMIDSDNVIIRPFDIAAYAGGPRTPLYVDSHAIKADAPLHARWIRNCAPLLGMPPLVFPADDYIGNVIVWDKQTVFAMTRAIESATKTNWVRALCRARGFSEYLLYGHFVHNSALYSTTHQVTTDSLANAYWDDRPLDSEAVAAMVCATRPPQVALCIESFSNTPVATIREAVGLWPVKTAGHPNSVPMDGQRVRAEVT